MTAETEQMPLGIHADYWLVQQYLQGDQDVWNVLYRRAYPVVKRYLYHQKSMDYLPASDAEDLLSERFCGASFMHTGFKVGAVSPVGSAASFAMPRWKQ